MTLHLSVGVASSSMPSNEPTWPTARRIRRAFRKSLTAVSCASSRTHFWRRDGRSVRNCSLVKFFLAPLSFSSWPRRAEREESSDSDAEEIVPMLVSSSTICDSISSTRFFILRIVSVAEMNLL